jgi:hypothetical protein
LRKIIVISVVLFVSVQVFGQNDSVKLNKDSISGRVYLLQQVKRNGEVLPEVNIREVAVVAPHAATKKSWYRKYDRLTYNLRTVYPYAVIVRSKLTEVNEALAGIKEEKERRKYLKDFEKEVFRDYEDDISNLTLTQGRLLLKLIDRETSNTSYDLIREYRGGISAAFWQGVARIFGTNLKEEYDPYGTDVVIELIVQDIESGRLW